MVYGKVKDVGIVDFNGGMAWTARCLGCFNLVKSCQIDFEDIESLFLVQWGIVEADVNPGFESLIHGANTVRGQEQNTIVVFKNSKED